MFEPPGAAARSVAKVNAAESEPAGNTHVTRYDERNLVFQVIRGFGSADESTTSVTYNRNGFPVLYFDAEDNDGEKVDRQVWGSGEAAPPTAPPDT